MSDIKTSLYMPYGEFRDFLGEIGRAEVNRLFMFLTKGPRISKRDEIWYRSCYSQILRGESQILRLPEVPYGYRASLLQGNQKPPLAILTFRPLAQMLELFGGVTTHGISWWQRIKGPFSRRTLSCLAECLIPTPKDYCDDRMWCINTLPQEVARHYGENFSLRTVPFIRPLEFLSGGVCAQACCWMLDHYAYQMGIEHAVLSLPEITYSARGDAADLNLAGLSTSEVISYYNARKQSKLWLTLQLVDGQMVATAKNNSYQPGGIPVETGGIRIITDALCQRVEQAIKCYLRSGFPVLLKVDAQRMMGRGHAKLPSYQNVYHESKWPGERRSPTQRGKPFDALHMIMLIGFKLPPHEHRIIFNDPGRAPFLEADIKRLFDSGPYLYPNSTDTFQFGDYLQVPQFLSATPREVTLPLLSGYSDPDLEQINDGLLLISEGVGWPDRDFTPDADWDDMRKAGGYFFLCQIASISSISKTLERDQPQSKLLVADLQRQLMDWNGSHWVWIEIRGKTLLVWNAQAAPIYNSPQSGLDFLMIYGAIRKENQLHWGKGNAIPDNLTTPEGVGQVQDESLANTLFQPALNTSYSARGIVNAEKNWPDPKLGVELALFQREEAKDLLPGYSLIRHSFGEWMFRSALQFEGKRFLQMLPRRPEIDRNATSILRIGPSRLPLCPPGVAVFDWIAQKYKDLDYIKRTAERIAKCCGRANNIFSASVFLPALSAPSHGPGRDRSIRALKFIVELVKVLNSSFNSKVQMIKISSGFRASEIGWTQIPNQDNEDERKAEDVFCVKMCEKQEAMRNWAESIQPFTQQIPPEIILSLDFEVGPLSIVTNYEDLKKFNQMLNDVDPDMGRVVGFHCNIPRFHLGGIRPENLIKDPDGPATRFVGFDLSDTGNGYFHDLLPGQVHKDIFFLKWKSVLDIASQSKINRDRAKMLITLKLERISNTVVPYAKADLINRHFNS